MKAEEHVEAGYIGRRVPRVEDRELVTGAARYVADLSIPGCVEATFVRSQVAHGILRRVELGEARSLPGVVGAYAAADLPSLPPTPTPPAPPSPPEMQRPALARDRVRYVGEPVAVVVAEDRGRGEDAVEAVLVEVHPLPAVLDPTEAARDAVRLFEGVSNVAAVSVTGEPVDEVLARAPVVVELAHRIGRVAPVSVEPRAIAVVPRDGGLEVWCSHQAPHRLRDALARAFGLDREAVRVRVPSVGGAFGAKSQTYPEYVVVAHLARELGRPVRWVEGRSEAFTAVHGRGQNQWVRLAADEEGRALALEVRIDADLGAYPQTGLLVPTVTAWVLPGPYRIPRLSVTVRGVVTNLPPTASYRGAGRPEAAFALERAMDELARRLGLDPAEVRRRNFIPPDAFPYRSPTGAVYDSGRYAEALDLALELAGYRELREEQRRRRASGTGPLLGIGIGSFLERSGGQTGTTEYGAVAVTADGSVEVRTGSTSQGQGHRTSFAQLAASVLDVELERVRVVQGDTGEVPEGTGTFGSRSLQVGGSAVFVCARRVLEEARARASELLEVAPEDLRYGAGRFSVVGSPDRSVTLGEIVARTGPLTAEELYDSPQAFPFGSYVAVVEVDRETGVPHLRRLVAVDDCGVVVNPLIVEGQSYGSLLQGVGQALYEGMVYDEQGQPLTTSLISYGVPMPTELPEIVLGETVTPNPNSPLGAKGAGEPGCIGAPPAVVNAVLDALEGYDVSGLDMPITAEKVWRALQRPLSRRDGRS